MEQPTSPAPARPEHEVLDDLDLRRPPPLRTVFERLADARWSQVRWPSLGSARWGRWAIGGLVLVVAAVVGWRMLAAPPAAPVEAQLPRASTSVAGSSAAAVAPAGNTSVPQGGVVVHVAGAVRLPGLRRLGNGTRVADALAAAGGPTADADLDRLNLAAPLRDGERVWVPRRGELTEPPVADGDGSGGGGGNGSASSGPVDLNQASEKDLEELPGVGPATAQAIIAYRDQHGGFRSVDELQDVRGIGDAKYAQLQPLVTVG
ncbi:MAG TPA: helix-hairpin-helix domain-containing protein [Acidimicrobiales bacterium]|jgi:competence protein ComEA|nr:helix-hairpin-helix domain-containing protein [Acidimicrobiales bacterium]